MLLFATYNMIENSCIISAFLSEIDYLLPFILLLYYREEGTFPYIPELPVHTEGMINYNQTLYHIRGIHTSPTGLESTSLVLCYGLGKNN